MTEAQQPLFEGLRVVEFGVFVAGPYAAEMFAHGGADVIKIEPIEGDATRFNSSIIPGEGRQYIIKARGKRGIPINLGHADGRAIARQLALRADVVISNMRPGTLARYELDYESLSAENPRIIVAEISAFGSKGPYGGLAGADFQAQAASGMLLSAGAFDGDEPRYTDAFLTDYMAGVLLAFGVSSALWRREQTGLGQQVGTTLFQAGLALQHGTASIFDAVDLWKREFIEWVRTEEPNTREASERRRMQGPFAAAGTYETADHRWIAVGASKRMLQKFLPLLGLDDPSISDHNWQPPDDPREHAAALRGRIKAAIANWNSNDLLQKLKSAGIPCAMAGFLEEAMVGEQATANDFVYSADHPAVGPMVMPTAPVRFGRDRYEAADRSPAFGQHMREILGEIGYSDDEIDAYIAGGVVAEHLPDPNRAW
ncbi:MAG: CoA transferase [Chloroflexi bacterium]|nr:CoA transferase [Chloroflexota bacterium]